MKKYNITPVPKPRMTRSDAWKKRPPVVRYWNFKAECKLHDLTLPEGRFRVCFALPMPYSWSKKKRLETRLMPHKQKPDLDNIIKALLDAVYEDDSHVYEIHATKIWDESGYIIIENLAS